MKKMAQKQMGKLKAKLEDVKEEIPSRNRSLSMPPVIIVQNSPDSEKLVQRISPIEDCKPEKTIINLEKMESQAAAGGNVSSSLPDEPNEANARTESDVSSILYDMANKETARLLDSEDGSRSKPSLSTDTSGKISKHPRLSVQSSVSSTDTARPILFKPNCERQTFI